MESENLKNATSLSPTKEDTVSHNDSNVAVHDNGTPLVITIHSDNEEVNTQTNISNETEKDSGVIYISDNEYDSDYEYRRKTNRPGPKSKTRYKLSEDEKDKVRARYGNKRPRLDKESADSEKEVSEDTEDSSIKDDSEGNDNFDQVDDVDISSAEDSDHQMDESEVEEENTFTYKMTESDEEEINSKDTSINSADEFDDVDILSVEDSDQVDESENEDIFTDNMTENDEVEINSKETSINEDAAVTELVTEHEKSEDVDKEDSKPRVHLMEENGTLKTTCQENCDEKKEDSSKPLNTDIDPKEILEETNVKNDVKEKDCEENKITNKESLVNNADNEVIVDADICPEDLQSSIVE